MNSDAHASSQPYQAQQVDTLARAFRLLSHLLALKKARAICNQA